MKTREKCVCAEGEGSEGLTGTGIVAAQGQMRSSVVQQERQRKRERARKISICTVCIERERCSDLWLCSGSVSPQLLHISMRHQQRCSAANPLINLTPATHTHTHQPRQSQLIHHTRCSIHNVHAHTFQIKVMLMVLHQTSDLTRLTSHYRKKSVYTHAYLNQTLKKS